VPNRNEREAQARDAARRRSGNPAVRAGAAEPGPAGPGRQRFEQRSRPWLTRLAALPGWALLVTILVLVIVGLLVNGWVGALLLLVVAALMVWLLALSWPVLKGRDRALRIAVIVLVLVDVVWKIATHH
jgi:hypothetical protein